MLTVETVLHNCHITSRFLCNASDYNILFGVE